MCFKLNAGFEVIGIEIGSLKVGLKVMQVLKCSYSILQLKLIFFHCVNTYKIIRNEIEGCFKDIWANCVPCTSTYVSIAAVCIDVVMTGWTLLGFK